ncbi:MAG: IS1182 family transposase, partial [Deltaproteobacteria bacterium]|nr:IS1182 family transposase [Deltaproteobacteria bacterium]
FINKGGPQVARYKNNDFNQMILAPISLAEQLVPGTLEYAIHHIIEERIDLGLFDARYRNDDIGRKAISPKVLLKVVLFGYSRGLLSSRSLEKACCENIIFMALACGHKPDHSTFSTFVSSLGMEIGPLFTKVLLICEEEELLGGTHFSLDGMKLSSNAAKEWSGTFSDLKKKQEALARKVKEALLEHREADKREKGEYATDQKRRDKRIKRLKQKAKRIEKFLAHNEPKTGSGGKEIQSNVTDNESAKMATSHGVVQGYNANAAVDEKCQVVLHGEAFGKGDDSTAMGTMLEGVRENLEAAGWEEPLTGMTISADTGYYSVKNLQDCKEFGVDAYVPDPQFRKRDVRFEDAGRHRRSVDRNKAKYTTSKKRFFDAEDFTLDDRSGKLICPAGHGLYVKNRNFVTGNGHKAIAYQAPKTACRGCALRSKCLRNPDTVSRQVHVFYGKRPGSITDEMKRKIDTPEGRRTYSKRLGIVEPVFGNIRSCKKMDRFTLRGRIKVNIQWLLYCLVHNIEKIANYGKTYAMALAQ